VGSSNPKQAYYFLDLTKLRQHCPTVAAHLLKRGYKAHRLLFKTEVFRRRRTRRCVPEAAYRRENARDDHALGPARAT